MLPDFFRATNIHSPIHAFRRIGLLIGFGLTTSVLAGSLDSLLENSPFGSAPRPEPVPATDELVLRSILVSGDVHAFSVFELSSKKARWLRLGESGGPITARDYNAEKGTLVVEYRGRFLTLPFNTDQVDLSNLTAGLVDRSSTKRMQHAKVAHASDPVPTISPEETIRLGIIAEILRAQLGVATPTAPREISGANGDKS